MSLPPNHLMLSNEVNVWKNLQVKFCLVVKVEKFLELKSRHLGGNFLQGNDWFDLLDVIQLHHVHEALN